MGISPLRLGFAKILEIKCTFDADAFVNKKTIVGDQIQLYVV